MKQNTIVIASLTILAIIAGYLLSGISLVGRTGINLVYTEYKFLKIWWKGGIVVLFVWIILFAIQLALFYRLSKSKSIIVQVIFIVVALAGFYFSYADFNNTLSHRLLGQRFHSGVYLFWLVWIAISIFILQRKKSVMHKEG